MEEADNEIEVIYDSTGTGFKKDDLKQRSKSALSSSVKKENEDTEYIEQETEGFKKDDLKPESKSALSSVKKEDEDTKYQDQETELELMAKMNLPTQFVYSNGRYQDDLKLAEICSSRFCSLCQVEMKDDRAYDAHVNGKKHLKKLIATSNVK